MMIKSTRDRGKNWESLGEQLSRSANVMQQRYRWVGGCRQWPTRLPFTY